MALANTVFGTNTFDTAVLGLIFVGGGNSARTDFILEVVGVEEFLVFGVGGDRGGEG